MKDVGEKHRALPILKKSWTLLALLTTLEILAVAIFSKGFFPFKTVIPGYADFDSLPSLPKLVTQNNLHDGAGKGESLEPKFGRLVFMLVDALRNLLASGNAHAYTAIATAPTVTLPRLKALTTGSVPNFLDAILNIAESDTSSSLKGQDSWVAQFKYSGKKRIAFYGDDTWIKLFPEMFDRSEGTTSFFVADTVEVDQNVTRHLEPEFARDDWDALILHYLGLDHVGHLAGPKSPLMAPKQKEMDEIVSSIYTKITRQDEKELRADSKAKPTLFVLCGDHGMNEVGNHGGSSIGEVSSVFVFMSSYFEKKAPTREKAKIHPFSFRELPQVDLVPTLSLLFGLPVPKNNLGKIIAELFTSHSDSDRLRALQLNSHQLTSVLYTAWPGLRRPSVGLSFDEKDLAGIMRDSCDQFETDSAETYACLLKRAAVFHASYLAGNLNAYTFSSDSYEMFLERAGALVSLSFSNYDLGLLISGVVCSLTCTAILCYSRYTARIRRDNLSCLSAGRLWVFLIVAYGVTLFASSYIEEEHQFWYFASSTAWLVHMFASLQREKFSRLSSVHAHRSKTHFLKKSAREIFGIPLIQLCILRLMRSWNQTGVKHAADIDLRHYLTSTYSLVSWWMFLVTISSISVVSIYCLYRQYRQCIWGWVGRCNFLLGSTSVALSTFLVGKYKLIADGGNMATTIFSTGDRDDLVPIAKMAYTAMFSNAGLTQLNRIFSRFGRGHLPRSKTRSADPRNPELFHNRVALLCILTTFAILLSRPHNAVLFLLSTVQALLLRRYYRDTYPTTLQIDDDEGNVPKSITLLIMSNTSFFLFGGSNSLATVDIGNSYIGVEGFSPHIVGALTFIGNWAGPLWWSAVSALLITEPSRSRDQTAAAGDCIVSESEQVTPRHPRTSHEDDDNVQSRTVSESSRQRHSHDPSSDSSPCSPAKLETRHRGNDVLLDQLFLHATFRSFVTTILSLSVTILRSHLFIWTVFSPRWLYEAAWVLGFGPFNIIIQLLFS